MASPTVELAAIVVLDNANTEGAGDYFAALDGSRLEVVTLDENRGGAGGFAKSAPAGGNGAARR